MPGHDPLTDQALEAAAEYIEAHPGSALHDQPLMWHGATNRIVRLIGADGPIVLKYFVNSERWQRELWGLKHFQPTGLVPQVLDASQQNTIVMTELATAPLLVDSVKAGRSLGRAAARLSRVPLSADQRVDFESRFYDGQSLEAYLGRIVRAGHAVQESCGVYQIDTFSESLALLDDQLGVILRQPRILYHQDAGNVGFDRDEVSGFFDLEMCRTGTLSTQIGSLFVLFQATTIRWHDVRLGLEAELDRRLDPSEISAALAFAHVLIWRYITRYGEWSGTFGMAVESQQEVLEAVGYAAALTSYSTTIHESS